MTSGPPSARGHIDDFDRVHIVCFKDGWTIGLRLDVYGVERARVAAVTGNVDEDQEITLLEQRYTRSRPLIP